MKVVRHGRRHDTQRTPVCEMNAVLNARSVKPTGRQQLQHWQQDLNITQNMTLRVCDVLCRLCAGPSLCPRSSTERLQIRTSNPENGSTKVSLVYTATQTDTDRPIDILRYITQTYIGTERQAETEKDTDRYCTYVFR